jgi:hypothetical protein
VGASRLPRCPQSTSPTSRQRDGAACRVTILKRSGMGTKGACASRILVILTKPRASRMMPRAPCVAAAFGFRAWRRPARSPEFTASCGFPRWRAVCQSGVGRVECVSEANGSRRIRGCRSIGAESGSDGVRPVGIGLAKGQSRSPESTRKRLRFISAAHRATGCLESSLREVFLGAASRLLPEDPGTDGLSVAKRQPLRADSGSRRVDATNLVAAPRRQDEWSHRRMVKEPTECQGPYESNRVAHRRLGSNPLQRPKPGSPPSASQRLAAVAQRQRHRPQQRP